MRAGPFVAIGSLKEMDPGTHPGMLREVVREGREGELCDPAVDLAADPEEAPILGDPRHRIEQGLVDLAGVPRRAWIRKARREPVEDTARRELALDEDPLTAGVCKDGPDGVLVRLADDSSHRGDKEPLVHPEIDVPVGPEREHPA